MRPHYLLLPLLLVAADPARTQGVVNPTLLSAPSAAAAATWSSATFERVQASVVYVCVEVDGPRGKFVIERASSGIVVDASGLVVTFHHLVAEAAGAADKKLLVQLNDVGNTRLLAKVVQHDEASGLVLLQVVPPAAGLQAARLGPDRPRVGEPVLVVARPEGKDMLAFAGVASSALAGVSLGGRPFAANEIFLTDSRNDLRCDGAPVFGADGGLRGIYATEHVQRDKTDATLAELKQPSFGVVVPTARLRAAFRAAYAGAGNESLRRAAKNVPHIWADAVQRVAPAVVSVWSGEGDWPQLGGKDPGCVRRRMGLGSGVVVSKNGLVVVNMHVCRAGEDVRVKTGEGKVYAAEVVKSNVVSNLSLLQLELPAGRQLPTAVCAADDDIELGEAVLAVGNPLATGVVVSVGVVSAMRGREGGRVQADANLGNQNGGGAIIDAAGRLVGIGDAGLLDPLEMAYAMRGDRVTQETNLSTFVGIRRVRRVFRSAFEDGAAAGESIVEPPPASAAVQQTRQSALTEMVKHTSSAMLNIYVAKNTVKVDPEDPFPPAPKWQTLSLGSGVIVDGSGLAISNWHVVEDATNPDGSMRADHRVTARVFGGKKYQVRVLSISREDDLSLLQLQLEPGEEVHAVEFGNSDALGIGEAVAAIGNPHGRANTITYGVVSAKGQSIGVSGRWAKLEHLIETDAAINGGNSGGALLDMNGRLVGINSAGGGTFNNTGYAIAVDHVRRQLLGLLFQPYKLRSADFGMRILDDDGKVLVMDVDARGPAHSAGVRSGDRITSLGGAEITWSPGFAMQLLPRQPGTSVELKVERNGEVKALSIAPLPAEVWSVVRQSGLQCRDFGFAEDPARVRKTSIALYREFTGDATGEPLKTPRQVVAVDRVFKQNQPEADIQNGDLILALEMRTAAHDDPVLIHIAAVAELRDWFNNREMGSYDGVKWRCWIARGTEVKAIDVVAKRLFW